MVGEPITKVPEVVEPQEPVKVESPEGMLNKIQGSGDGDKDASEPHNILSEGSGMDVPQSTEPLVKSGEESGLDGARWSPVEEEDDQSGKDKKAEGRVDSASRSQDHLRSKVVEKWLDSLEPSHDGDYRTEYGLKEEVRKAHYDFVDQRMDVPDGRGGFSSIFVKKGSPDHIRLRAKEEALEVELAKYQERMDNDALRAELPKFIRGSLADSGGLVSDLEWKMAIRDEGESGNPEVALRIPEIVEAIKAGDMSCIAKMLDVMQQNAWRAGVRAKHELSDSGVIKDNRGEYILPTERLRSIVENPRAPRNSPGMNELGMELLNREIVESARSIEEGAGNLIQILVKRGLTQEDAPRKSWGELLDQRKQAETTAQSPESVAS